MQHSESDTDNAHNGGTVFSRAGNVLRQAWQSVQAFVEKSAQSEAALHTTERVFFRLSQTQDIGEALDVFDSAEAEIADLKARGILAENYEIPYDPIDMGIFMNNWEDARIYFGAATSAARLFTYG